MMIKNKIILWFVFKIIFFLLLLITINSNAQKRTEIRHKCLLKEHLTKFKSLVSEIHNQENLIKQLELYANEYSNIVNLTYTYFSDTTLNERERGGNILFLHSYFNKSEEEIIKLRYYKNLKQGGFSIDNDTLIYLEETIINAELNVKLSVVPVYPRLNVTQKHSTNKNSSTHKYSIPKEIKVDYTQPYIHYKMCVANENNGFFEFSMLIELPVNEKKFWCFSSTRHK